jgi:hypothetical protein
MFSYLPNLKTFSPEIIAIDYLISLIKAHPNANKIERIRSIEYKCVEYNKIKETLPCITTHGYFTGLKKDDLLSTSGYLYYDIDGFSTESEMQKTIDNLNHDFDITMICTSCGGRGISMLIKVLDLNEENFIETYNYVSYLLKGKGYDIDTAASGISRKMIISFDLNVIYNKDKYLNINNDLRIKYIKESNNSKKNNENKKEMQYTVNDTLIEKEIIPMDILKKTITLETTYDKEIIGDFIIDTQEYYKILIPKKINDGDKHRVYIRIMYALHFLNPRITCHEVFSFLYHVNIIASPKMEYKKLLILTKNLFAKIQKDGFAKVKTRTKKIHFNQTSDLSVKEKQSMSAKINGRLKTNNTIDIIKEAKEELLKKNEKPTQKNVVAITNLSIATVKRRWIENKVPIEKLDLTAKKEENTTWKLSPDSPRNPFDVFENDFIKDENEKANEDGFFDDFFDDFFDFEGD